MSVLGIKVGNSSCRALLVSIEGDLLAHARQEYVAPIDGPLGRILDPLMVWRAARSVIAQVAQGNKIDPIRAVCVTSTGDAMVPVASSGQTLGPCILAGNHAAASPLEEALDRLGGAMFQEISGSVPPANGLLAELCWLRKHQTKQWERLGRATFLGSWISQLLGGRAIADMSLAGNTNLLDIAQGRWSGRLADGCGISRFKLPELGHAGDALGICATGISEQLDLPQGVRLFLGGQDSACAALGAGVLTSDAYLHLGSSLILSPAFQAIPLRSLMSQSGLGMWRHVVGSTFVSRLQNGSGGSVLQWLRDLLLPVRPGAQSGPSYNVIERFLGEMPEAPTQLMSLPGFAPSAPPFAREGHAGALIGLDTHTSRGELVKAVLEGMSYELSLGINLLQGVGISIQALRCAGGGSRSARWLQLIADITGLPVERVVPSDPALLGAAMLAAVGSGAYGNLDEAARRLVRVSGRYEPNRVTHTIYAERIARFSELAAALRENGWYGSTSPMNAAPSLMHKAS